MNAEVNDLSCKSKYALIIVSLVLVGIFFMYGSVNSKNKNPKTILPETTGVETFSGVVKNIETIENIVFIVVGKDSKETVYYTSTGRAVAKEVLKLKVGDNVDLKYARGAPKKYKEVIAMPLLNIKVIE
ncbi:hypothetical protein KPL35_08475 [Clostridium sp. CF011]|uniref:hypothetical protein n=2 Tax=Clostridium sp. CF011 TaxID=2843318 RepID=UPI001C0DC722|nr:hypothetical protein [Clostridium sp. CF011]MBU3092114.1 hypothetical protein [Clostridium sp. CF011]